MARGVFIGVPAFGMINPTLPLAMELVRRGEDITYYATPEFKQVIERTGAVFRDTPIATTSESAVALDSVKSHGAGALELARAIMEHTDSAIAGLLSALRAEPPDYIVHDSCCLWGLLVARLLGIRAICCHPTFAINGWVSLSMTPGVPAALWDVVRRRHHLQRFRRLAACLARQYQTPRLRVGSAFSCYEPLTIVFTSRLFQPFGSTFDNRFKFVGSSLDEEDELGDLAEHVRDGDSMVYISLGTFYDDRPDFYRACFEAFRDLDRRVIMKIGRRVDAQTLGTPPPNFLIRSWVPSQIAMLRRSALFVTHGGMNSVSEALYFGVPMVVIPQAMEHGWIAQRVQQLGAGRMLRHTRYLARPMRRAAAELLAVPRYRESSRRIGASLREAGGPSRAADELQAFVAKPTGSV